MLKHDWGLENWHKKKKKNYSWFSVFNYRIFKTDFKFEEYFNILDEQNSLLLCKFRTTNHKLPIEKGRWSNIPRENRYCELCQKNQIGYTLYNYSRSTDGISREDKLSYLSI
jgi:hypothetical protein